MQNLKHGDKVVVAGRKGHVGTVGGYAAEYDDDPISRIQRAQDRKHTMAWVNQEPTTLCGDPGYYEQQRAYWADAIQLVDGQIVWLEGQLMKVHYKGNYSDMVDFEPVVRESPSQSGPMEDGEYTIEDMIAVAHPPMLLHDQWGNSYWHTPKLLALPSESTMLRAEADRKRAAVEESFDRSDTDGFLSQWAIGLGAQQDDLQADILENGGVAEFPALFDLQGNRVRAKLIQVPDRFNYGRPKSVWAFCDLQDRLTGKFINPFPKRASTMEKKGYREGTETAPAKADIVGYGRGLSGSAWVATVRTDKGYPETAGRQHSYQCQECGTTFGATEHIDPREEAYAGRLYEPLPIYCPHCGSDYTEPAEVAARHAYANSDAAIERAERNACGLWDK